MEEVGNKRDIAERLSTIGNHYHGIGEYDTALDYHQKSHSLYQIINDTDGIATQLIGIGTILREKKDYQTALDYFKRGLSLRKKLGNTSDIILSYFYISSIYERTGKLNQALEHLQEALDLAMKEDEKKSLVYIYDSFSKIYAGKGDFQRSLEFNKKALAESQQLEDKLMILWMLMHRGWCYYWFGDLMHALEHSQKALKGFEEFQYDPLGIGWCLNLVGEIYRVKGEVDLALENLQACLTKFETVTYKMGIPPILNSIGMVYQNQGQLSLARDYYERALASLDTYQLDPNTIPDTLFNLVLVTDELHERDISQNYLIKLKKMTEMSEIKGVGQRIQLAEAIWLKGSPRISQKVKAQEILRQLVTEGVIEHEIAALATFHLCDLLLDELKLYGEQEVLQEVNTHLDKVHEISLNQQSSQLTVQTLLLRSKFLLLDGDLTTASSYLDQAQIITEEKGLYQLHTRVLEQQKSLQAELEQWSDLIARNAPLKERIELAHLDEYISLAIEIRDDNLDKRLEIPTS